MTVFTLAGLCVSTSRRHERPDCPAVQAEKNIENCETMKNIIFIGILFKKNHVVRAAWLGQRCEGHVVRALL